MGSANLEWISQELSNISLGDAEILVAGRNSLQGHIKDTLIVLHNTRLKKKVFEVNQI